MISFSTREVARKLGITQASLSRYMAAGKIPTPEVVTYGRFRVHAWTEADVERVRDLLPKIKNGRKTRHTNKQSAKPKPKKPQPRAVHGAPGSSTVPHGCGYYILFSSPLDYCCQPPPNA